MTLLQVEQNILMKKAEVQCFFSAKQKQCSTPVLKYPYKTTNKVRESTETKF